MHFMSIHLIYKIHKCIAGPLGSMMALRSRPVLDCEYEKANLTRRPCPCARIPRPNSVSFLPRYGIIYSIPTINSNSHYLLLHYLHRSTTSYQASAWLHKRDCDRWSFAMAASQGLHYTCSRMMMTLIDFPSCSHQSKPLDSHCSSSFCNALKSKPRAFAHIVHCHAVHISNAST